MNERIKKLAEQAGLKQGEWSGHPPVWMETLDSPGGLEKFAELIVRECINISTKVDKNPYVPDHDQAKKIIREIKQHFGVE